MSKRKDRLIECPLCQSLVRADRIDAHVSLRCPKRNTAKKQGPSTSEDDWDDDDWDDDDEDEPHDEEKDHDDQYQSSDDDLVTCRKCDGSGTVSCDTCSGSGTELDTESSGGLFCAEIPCSSCDGSGTATCPRCGGSGKTTEESNGHCYLTTACVVAIGLDDESEELKVLRQFRDGYVLQLDGGQKIVEEYYNRAPALVSAITQSKNGHREFRRIYSEVIQPCVTLIQKQRFSEALEVYRIHFERLIERFSAICESSGVRKDQ